MDNSTQYERLRFIELIVVWEGEINTGNLTRQFQISRQQASKDINCYKEQSPGSLIYDASLKCFLPSTHFQCIYPSTTSSDYLFWREYGLQKPLSSPEASSCSSLVLPSRNISPLIMRALVKAMRHQYRIEVDYVSLSNPNGMGRIVIPHHFVKTGLRWHLRAWCEKSKAYRDFVLSRFRGTPDFLGPGKHDAVEDIAWNTNVTVLLQPDPRLSKEKREVLENDYQMSGGVLPITTRGCLVQYLLRELQVNIKMLDGTPEAQQLVCVNLVDIKQWLFEG